MKELCFLFTIFLFVIVGVVLLPVLIPVFTIGISLLFTVGFFLIWLLPILLIANSDKTTGTEKLAWILAIIFLSWFAWIFYFLLAPIKPKEIVRYKYRYHY